MNSGIIADNNSNLPNGTDSLSSDNYVNLTKFTGNSFSLFKLFLKNAFLTIITLGIYRFWARTNERRFIWSNIQFDDDPFEYIGLAKELLIGFLIVIAVLLPLAIAAGILDTVFADLSPTAKLIQQFIYYAIIGILIQIAIFRTWRYRMTRTLWRGIRFGLDGTTGQYLKITLFWFTVTILTLGLAYPWYRAASLRYRIGNTTFGQSKFECGIKGIKLFKYWSVVYFSLIVFYGGLGFLIYTISNNPGIIEPTESSSGNASFKITDQAAFSGLSILPGIGIISFILTLVWYRVREFRTLVASTAIGQSSFKSQLSFVGIIGIFLAINLVTLGLFVFFGILSTGLIGVTIGFGALLFIPLMFLFFVFIVVIRKWLFTRYILTKIMQTLGTSNPESISEIVQSAKASEKFGEGLADAVDVAEFDLGGI